MKMFMISDSVQKDIVEGLMEITENSNDPTLIDTISNIVHIFESSLTLGAKEDAVDKKPSEEDRTLPSEILVAIGQASMCWEHPERAGVFDDQEAVRISHLLYETILEEYI